MPFFNHNAHLCAISLKPFLATIDYFAELRLLELIQTHMIQKPMLRVEVSTRALRASHNVKKNDAFLVCSLCLNGYMGVFSDILFAVFLMCLNLVWLGFVGWFGDSRASLETHCQFGWVGLVGLFVFN